MTGWKSARLHGGVMLQLLSAPLQNGLRFIQHPLSATSTAHLAMTPASPMRRDVGFTVFRSSNMDELAPVSMPAVVVSVCPKSLMGAADCIAFWREPVSIFGSAGFDGTFDSSLVLDLSSSLTL